MNPIIRFEEKSRRLDKEYAAYLKGKSVCIVARGGLYNMEQGEFIDSHDVVVRVHNMQPYSSDNCRQHVPVMGHIMNVPEPWQSRVGSKCNILFFCHIMHGKPKEFVLKIFTNELKAFREIGGKFLCGESWLNHSSLSELVWRSIFPIRYLTHDHYLNTMRAIGGSNPYGGTLVAADILRHDIERVYITGMPGYPNHKDPFGNSDAQPVNDLRFLVDLSIKHPDRVSIDDNMKQAWEYTKNG